MSYRAKRITKALRCHDSKLFCEENSEGKLCVFRKGQRWDSFAMDDGSSLLFLRPDHHFVFALTDTWTIRGRPVDWGIQPIMNRVKACDLWGRDIVSEIKENQEKRDESNERDMKNSIESFLKDFRRQFAKATDVINTAGLAKRDPRERGDKSKWAL